MDEANLRQKVCDAGRQLWVRRVISGDDGMVTAELNRRRYIATPTGRRRADLAPNSLLCVDLGGVNIVGGDAINDPAWRPHRLAYQGSMALDTTGNGAPREIHATVMATPPNVMALLTLDPAATAITLIHHPDLPVIHPGDDDHLQQMILQHPAVLLPETGVLAAGRSLDACLNQIESLEHHASIELATRGSRA